MGDEGSQGHGSDIDDYSPMAGHRYTYPDSDDSEVHGISLKHLREQFELLDASLVAKEVNETDLKEEIWKYIPEEILWRILTRLPVTTQCRFRCVSSSWKVLLSARSSARQHISQGEARPLCTIMTEQESSSSWFFSNAEDKWCRLPFQPESHLDGEWRLTATDGGLLCYTSFVWSMTWLLVCNPITGASQIVPPRYPNPNMLFIPKDFSVDRISNSFRIILVAMRALDRQTVIFDSRTQVWDSFPSPGFNWGVNEFVWRNTIYIQSGKFGQYRTFDIESKQWGTIEVDMPCDAQKKYYLVSNKDHVMLVQLHPKDVDPLRIWMLVDTEDVLSLLFSRWAKVVVEVPDSMMSLVKHIQGCWSYRNEFVCFATLWTHHWVKYTFATKTWQVMPSGGKLRPLPDWDRPGFYHWLHWEPCLDSHVESIEFDGTYYLELLASYRLRMNSVRERRDSTGSDDEDESDWDDASGNHPSGDSHADDSAGSDNEGDSCGDDDSGSPHSGGDDESECHESDDSHGGDNLTGSDCK